MTEEVLPKKRVSYMGVRNLFGHFNHSVDFRLNDRITIIHGPNGYGKTVLLRMLHSLLHGRISALKRYPFDSFTVRFHDGDEINVKRSLESEDPTKQARRKKPIRRVILSVAHKRQGREETYTPKRGSDSRLDYAIRYIDGELPEFTRLERDLWQHIPTGELLDLEEIVEQFGYLLPFGVADRKAEEPLWLTELRKSMNVRLIEAQRLISFAREREQAGLSYDRSRSSNARASVISYSNELSQLIQSTLARYAATSQKLDSSFPSRVLLKHSNSQTDQSQLESKLKELESTRQRIISAGLLDKEDQTQLGLSQSFDDSTKNILALYAQDIDVKLEELTDLTRRIELFKNIVNQRFSFKQIAVDKVSGFRFVSTNNDQLQPTDLSSGEQHELVLFYELLFKTEEGALILIDEPELSLHVSWQVQFLEDLASIVRLSTFDVLLATHSPQIINDRWDLTEELKGNEDAPVS
jgi:predicted ATP-binding protein involved in virulence